MAAPCGGHCGHLRWRRTWFWVSLDFSTETLMRNVGQTDRLFRIVIGIGILAYFILGTWSAWAFLGVLLLVTGLIGYCPLYSLLRINTNRRPLTG